MLMDIALYNDSSLLPIFFFGILFGFVERPVVEVLPFAELVLWMRRASLPCTPTDDVTFVSFQVGPDCPVTSISIQRFYKEIEIRGAFQLEHLQRKMKVLIKLQIYLSSHADQPSALVLPLTLCLSFLGCSTQADCQAAGGRAHKRLTCHIIKPVSTNKNLPASGTWLVVGTSFHTCLQVSSTPFLPNQPLIS